MLVLYICICSCLLLYYVDCAICSENSWMWYRVPKRCKS